MFMAGTASADVIRLKDGRSIPVDSWRYEGSRLIFEQAGGTIAIPRSLVERVEAEPRPSPSRGPARETGTPLRLAGARSTGTDSATPAGETASDGGSDDDLRDTVETLKRDLRSHPERRDSTSRQIAARLTILGNRAVDRQDSPRAEEFYREALAFDSRFLPAIVGLSSAHLREGKDHYAQSQIQEGLVAFPDDPVLHFLLGEVHYRREDLQNAIGEWETSLSLRDDARVAARLEKARREFAVDRDFARAEAPHFTLRFEGGGAAKGRVGPSIRDYLEEQYGELVERFRFVPPAPFVVLLYPSRDFYEATRAPSNVGGLFDGKIRVPVGGLHALTPAARAVLLHELTHAFVFGKSGGNCPRWLQEGLAQLVEGKVLLPSEEKALARKFAASAGGAWHPEFSYAAALSFTRYLADRFRFETLVDALEKMRTGLSDAGALGEVTREGIADLQEEWGKHLLEGTGGNR